MSLSPSAARDTPHLGIEGRGDAEREWVREAIAIIEADNNRSADTHLLRVELPALSGVRLYLKDESTHPTGSLKHRLARSLFLYALCNGWVGPRTTIVEASSGSTAVSEAYFARLLGLDFVAVMPRGTSHEKICEIERYGGRCHFVEEGESIYDASRGLAVETGGHYMDQFTYAERATDWRGNNNIAESIFAQLAREEYRDPAWIVCGAGTGGTLATLGRYARYRGSEARVCLVDPEASVFHRHLRTPDRRVEPDGRSVIEGIGRPRVEPSFLPDLVDRCIVVSDLASIAAARVLSRHLGRPCGGSTGTNFWGAALIASEMQERRESGAIVTLLCDSGYRYGSSYFDDKWIAGRGFDLAPYEARLTRFLRGGGLTA